jgi:hypothetical protein
VMMSEYVMPSLYVKNQLWAIGNASNRLHQSRSLARFSRFFEASRACAIFFDEKSVSKRQHTRPLGE